MATKKKVEKKTAIYIVRESSFCKCNDIGHCWCVDLTIGVFLSKEKAMLCKSEFFSHRWIEEFNLNTEGWKVEKMYK